MLLSNKCALSSALHLCYNPRINTTRNIIRSSTLWVHQKANSIIVFSIRNPQFDRGTASTSFYLSAFRCFPTCATFSSSRRIVSSMEKGTRDHTVGSWYSVPDLKMRDHRFIVPLDYKFSDGPLISVFAREVVGGCLGYLLLFTVIQEDNPLPYLLYLQGGPGFESPRPEQSSGWLKKACEEYRVILLDQRGTGLSTALTVSSLSQISSARQQADFLQYFRADNIINDAEFIRIRIVPNEVAWTVLGQSFGGFCAVTYLSFAPQGLKQVLLTGGIPPIDDGCTANYVYKACYKRVLLQNQKYYERYPQDKEIIHEVVLHLAESEGMGVPLPSGGILTPRGLQLLGLSGLGSSGGFERLHYMFEKAWDPVLVPGTKRQLSYTFKRAFENWIGFDTNPLYAILHEVIYCQGAASQWSAHRVRDEFENSFNAVQAAREGRPVFFTGEMVFPWMFDEIGAIHPLKEAAQILAEKEDWPPLYDIEKLRKNKDAPLAGHLGFYKTYRLLKERFSWKGLKEDVLRYLLQQLCIMKICMSTFILLKLQLHRLLVLDFGLQMSTCILVFVMVGAKYSIT